MLKFKNRDELSEFVKDTERDTRSERMDAAMYAAKCRSYDLGAQWIQQQTAPAAYYKLTRKLTNWVGSSGPIRATVNRTTRYLRQIASVSNPNRLDVDCLPGDKASSMDAVTTADLLEIMANTVIDDSGLLKAARRANLERTVVGDCGIGLHLERRKIKVQTEDGEVDAIDMRMKAYDFDYSKLILDPYNQSYDLTEHEFVIHHDVWTVHKLKRMFGGDKLRGLDEKKLRTVAELAPMEIEFYRMSGGKLYQQYWQHSKTKAAVVYEVFVKTEDGRFGELYYIVDLNDGKPRVVNWGEDAINPWGGKYGMPKILLRGHPRSRSRQSISDCGMMMDDQDKMNLIASLYFQQMYNYTHRGKWMIERPWMGDKLTDESIYNAFSQEFIITDKNAGSKQYVKPPTYVGLPEPSMTLDASMRQYGEDMREQAGRPEIDQGRLKSHVTNQHLSTSVERTQLVIDDRISEDIASYEQLIETMLGTAVLGLQNRWYGLAKKLDAAGLDADDMALLVSVDHETLPVDVRVRQQAIRKRSRDSRRRDLLEAMQLQGLDPATYRRVMARDLDMPLDDMDKMAARSARYAASRIIAGEEWVPMPLGPYTSTYVDEFYRAMMMKETMQIEGGQERLAQAILDQHSAFAEEQMVIAGGALQQGGAVEPEETDEEPVMDILAQMGV